MAVDKTKNKMLTFYVSNEEFAFIKSKMTKAKIKNQSEYLREMAIHGKVINIDF